MTPGSNILAAAMTAIAPESVKYYQYLDRTLNTVGQYVASYAAPVVVDASVQPIQKKAYVQMGLDLKRQYSTVYVQLDAQDSDRDQSGDRFVTSDGIIWQVESNNDWFRADGWVSAVCVRVIDELFG